MKKLLRKYREHTKKKRAYYLLIGSIIMTASLLSFEMLIFLVGILLMALGK